MQDVTTVINFGAKTAPAKEMNSLGNLAKRISVFHLVRKVVASIELEWMITGAIEMATTRKTTTNLCCLIHPFATCVKCFDRICQRCMPHHPCRKGWITYDSKYPDVPPKLK